MPLWLDGKRYEEKQERTETQPRAMAAQVRKRDIVINKWQLLIAVIVLVAALLVGSIAFARNVIPMQVSPFGLIIDGKKVLGDLVYTGEVRAVGTEGLKVRNSDGSGGLHVLHGGDVHATDAISATSYIADPRSASPSTVMGTIYYDSDDENLYVYDGTWTDLTIGAAVVDATYWVTGAHGTLTNEVVVNDEASLYAALTDVSDFVQGGEVNSIDSGMYVDDSIDNAHVNWADIDYLGDEGAGVSKVYSSTWNADVGPPQKDDIYDYLHQMDTDDDGDVDNFDPTNLAAAETDPNVDTADEIEAILTNDPMDFGTGSVSGTGMDAGDGNVTNIGDIAIDSISGDAGAGGEIVINEAGLDMDVRIEATGGITGALFVEGSSGNVGIGTTGPLGLLNIGETSTGPILNVGGVDGATSYITARLSGMTSGYGSFLHFSDSNTYNLAIGTLPTSGDFAVVSGKYPGTAGTTRFVVQQNGNVGIGTTGPTTAATISGTLGIGLPTAPTNGPNMIVFAHQATTPTMAANTAGIFSQNGELWTIDADENTMLQTSHPDELNGRLGYKSCNFVLGECVLIDVEAAITDLENGITGGSYITRTRIPEDQVVSWHDTRQAFAEKENVRRLAEAAAVLAPTVDAVEAYSVTVTVPVSPTEYITTSITTYEFDAATGETVEVTTVTTETVTEEVETGETLWRLKDGCQVDEETGGFMCPIGEEDAEYEEYEAQPMPEWMQERFVTVILAPQDLSGLEKPEGTYKKLVDIGDYALWAGWAESEALLGLHDTLWAMSPTETLGILAAVQTRGTDFYDARVRRATGMMVQQALTRRDRIADYLDGLGKNTEALRAAMTEHSQMVAIVEALGFTEQQLWAAMSQ